MADHDEPTVLGITEAMLRNVADAAHQARTARPRPGTPLCDQQLAVDSDPTGPVLLCYLPAGHHSEEHYDRAADRVWLPPGVEPRPRPGLDRPEPG